MIAPLSEAVRLAAVYETAEDATRTSGRAWYALAAREAEAMAEDFTTSADAAAGVVAALSPRMAWHANLDAAARVLRAAATGAEAPPRVGLGDATRKAWRIARGETPLDVLGGDKVRAFYRAIAGDAEAVTIDVHAARAARGTSDGRPPSTSREYDRLAAAYTVAAEAVGEAPRDFQAIIWQAERGIREDARYYTLARRQTSLDDLIHDEAETAGK